MYEFLITATVAVLFTIVIVASVWKFKVLPDTLATAREEAEAMLLAKFNSMLGNLSGPTYVEGGAYTGGPPPPVS